MLEIEETIEFKIAALGADEGAVDFADFRAQLDALSAALVAVDEQMHVRPAVRWIVHDLHHSRPAIVLAGVREPQSIEQGATRRVLATLFSAVEGLRAGNDNGELPYEALQAVRKLVEPIGHTVKEVSLDWQDRHASLDVPFKATLQKVKFTTEHSEEDWQGALEEINIHLERPTFRLYPAGAQRHLTCVFDRKDLELVRAALTHKVGVSGRAAYRPNATFPYRLVVRDLAVLDMEPGSLEELGGASLSRDHLDKLSTLRNGWN